MEILVRGCPPGLGEPVFDKLEADLAKALMSIGAVRGVEVGAGFGAARMQGSRCNDPIGPGGFEKNDAGGILGGISNGEEIRLRVAVKPIPSIALEQNTVDHSREARLPSDQRPARCLRHPQDQPGLRGHGRDRSG